MKSARRQDALVYVDTSIWMNEHVHADDATRLRFLDRARGASLGLRRVVAPVVLSELFFSATDSSQNDTRIDDESATSLVRLVAKYCAGDVIEDDIQRALELMSLVNASRRRAKRLRMFDALHMAIADRLGCSRVITADKVWPLKYPSAYGRGPIEVQLVTLR